MKALPILGVAIAVALLTGCSTPTPPPTQGEVDKALAEVATMYPKPSKTTAQTTAPATPATRTVTITMTGSKAAFTWSANGSVKQLRNQSGSHTESFTIPAKGYSQVVSSAVTEDYRVTDVTCTITVDGVLVESKSDANQAAAMCTWTNR
ncbi:MAG TPA: hypothetical protein VFU07_09630 [Candidatus Lumbricidophila sp.]|nr:hypothetical protein [Candidatus Lumbricidophila sp.]